ncbi:type II toxin-antitoxin system PemK/MazF family toxin [Sulfoacidibacillus ferrooxidans]|uniref:Growth inhibitor n=1 Tax=Sulfoacidibacillus ferrooxidans TaxID=2005001 RepID=A0A9X1VEX5_9BACL|nr:hypothetical protein [Sulfoacidibacillus ferrooxidans]
MTYPRQGDVIKISFPYSNLTGTKERPGLVLSTESYSRATNECLVVQITTKHSPFRPQYQIQDWKHAGLTKSSWIRYLVMQHVHGSLVLDVLGEFPHDEYLNVVSLITQAISIR